MRTEPLKATRKEQRSTRRESPEPSPGQPPQAHANTGPCETYAVATCIKGNRLENLETPMATSPCNLGMLTIQPYSNSSTYAKRLYAHIGALSQAIIREYTRARTPMQSPRSAKEDHAPMPGPAQKPFPSDPLRPHQCRHLKHRPGGLSQESYCPKTSRCSAFTHENHSPPPQYRHAFPLFPIAISLWGVTP